MIIDELIQIRKTAVGGTEIVRMPLYINNKKIRKKSIKYYQDSNGCFICTSHSRSGGYPSLSIKQTSISVVKYLWMIHKGEIPKNMCLCHSCDNPMCINLDHIWLGTKSENLKDMWNKQRGTSRAVTPELKKKIKSTKKSSHYLSQYYEVFLARIDKIKNE
jgi:hypothetical protein